MFNAIALLPLYGRFWCGVLVGDVVSPVVTPGWLPLTPPHFTRYLYVFISRLTEGVPELL